MESVTWLSISDDFCPCQLWGLDDIAWRFHRKMFFCDYVVTESFRDGGKEGSQNPVPTNFAPFPITFWLLLPTIYLQPSTSSNWASQWPIGTFAILCLCTHMHFLLPCILFFPSYHRITKFFEQWLICCCQKKPELVTLTSPANPSSISLSWLTSLLAFT